MSQLHVLGPNHHIQLPVPMNMIHCSERQPSSAWPILLPTVSGLTCRELRLPAPREEGPAGQSKGQQESLTEQASCFEEGVEEHPHGSRTAWPRPLGSRSGWRRGPAQSMLPAVAPFPASLCSSADPEGPAVSLEACTGQTGSEETSSPPDL